jgi:hypothetical protein
MNEYIISYEFGYHDWYVSEFYKFFHKNLEEKMNMKFEYMSIRELAEKLGHHSDNHSDSPFNWFNLIIMNKKNEKMFIHSWYDYAHVTVDWCVKNQLNVVKFSCVSNLNNEYIEKYDFVQPSIYYFENWSDHSLVTEFENTKKTNDKIYFAGLNHGIRENIMNKLKGDNHFEIYSKREEFRQKRNYFEELSSCKFGLSLNGAANVCYRDLELFGLNVLNLREPLVSNFYEPIVENVHYLNFIDNDFVSKILGNESIDSIISEKIKFLENFYNSKEYNYMVENSKEWFNRNCLPLNQFNILYSFLDELEILN